MAIDLKSLPRVSDTPSFVYLEQCRVEQDDLSIAAWDIGGITAIPIANLHAILLGPGTVITQAAVRAIADNGCAIVWCGERGVRTYACAQGETRSARNLIRQAALATRESSRLEVVTRMYRIRFSDPLPEEATLQQIRGLEGVRVKKAYWDAAKLAGVEWDGRSYNRKDWDDSTPINRALSAANACMHGLAHAVIVALGYSPGLGFIHCGKQLSFVYDIADLYKVEYAVPAAFEAAREDQELRLHPRKIPLKERLTVEQRSRFKMRDLFAKNRLLERMPRDIAHVLNVPVEEMQGGNQWDDDPAAPASLWEPSVGAAHAPLAASPEGERRRRRS